jgi:hypothetical protein
LSALELERKHALPQKYSVLDSQESDSSAAGRMELMIALLAC